MALSDSTAGAIGIVSSKPRQAGAGEESGGEAGPLGADGEDRGAVEAGPVEILAAAGDQGGPAGMGEREMRVERLGSDPDGDGEAQQAPRRGAQGAGVVRVGAPRRQREAGGAGRLGDAGERSQVAGILEPLQIEVGAVRTDGEGLDPEAGEPGHGEQPAGGVGVGQLGEQLGAHHQRRQGKGADELAPSRLARKGGVASDLLEDVPRPQRRLHQVGPLEQGEVAFTSPGDAEYPSPADSDDW